jgi:alkaline phosphatase
MRAWLAAAWLMAPTAAIAAPTVSRLTPPSELFASGRTAPIVARFLAGQKFDLQATLIPDAGQEILSVQFLVDDRRVTRGVADRTDRGLRADLPAHSVVASVRGYFCDIPGVHRLSVEARQSDGQFAHAQGNFVVIWLTSGAHRAKNIIFLLGDGMGVAHRTAARIVASGYAQGKVLAPLAMDGLPNTAMVMTASLNSIVTDSAPGMSAYVTGNKGHNNQEGVFPDDSVDPFDNPRVEYLSQYLHRRFGTSTGLVTTADVFDATPAANAVYTADRGAGTGIVDQYFDDRELTGLRVLLGGGRKWFLPNVSDSIDPQPANGSQRRSATDYSLAPAIVLAWASAPGALDSSRDLLHEFRTAGYAYAPDTTALAAMPRSPTKLQAAAETPQSSLTTVFRISPCWMR